MTRLNTGLAYQSPQPSLGKALTAAPKKRPMQNAIFRTNKMGQPVDEYGNVERTDWERGPFNPAARPAGPLLEFVRQGATVTGPAASAVSMPSDISPAYRGALARSVLPTSTFDSRARDARERSLPYLSPETISARNAATAQEAMEAGRRDVSTVSGAMAAGNWNQASRMLHDELVRGGQDIRANQAAGNEQLRLASILRNGNRSPETQIRGQYWMGGGGPPAPPEVPTGYVDQGERTAPAVVGGAGHRILRATPEEQQRQKLLLERIRNYANPANQAHAGNLSNPEWAKAHRERKARKAYRQAGVIAGAMKDQAERDYRMSGAAQRDVQQQMLNNYLAARNPALALGMMQSNTRNMQDERRFQLQLEELKRQGRLAESANTRETAMTRASIAAQIDQTHPNATPEEKNGMIEAAMSGKAYSPNAPAAEGNGTPAAAARPGVPEWARGMTNQQIVDTGTTVYNLTDEQINEILAAANPDNPNVSAAYPEGPGLGSTLWYSIFGENPNESFADPWGHVPRVRKGRK